MGRIEREDHDSDVGVCPSCGCQETMVDDLMEEVICSDCGLVLENPYFLDDGSNLRWGENPQNTPSKSLGSRIKGSDRTSRRLMKTHDISTRKRKDFMAMVDDLVDGSGEGDRTKDAVKRFLAEANRDLKLSSKRNKLRGTRGMSTADSSDYRRKLLVSSALHVINDDGTENRAPQIALQWDVEFNDLAGAVRMLRRWRELELRKQDGYMPEDPLQRRTRELNYWLTRLRDFLTTVEGVSFEQANSVLEVARQSLRENGEPVQHGDKWMMGGKFNAVSKRAAMESMIEAMASLGMSSKQAKMLGQMVPVPGMSVFIERCGKRVFSDVDGSGSKLRKGEVD